MSGSGDLTASVPPSELAGIDGLLVGARWADGFITYSDPDSVTDYQPGHPEPFSDFQQATSSQVLAAQFALDGDVASSPTAARGFSVEGFTNLDVSYAGSGSGTGTIRIANTSNPDLIGAAAYAYYPDNGVTGGDAFFGSHYRNPTAGNFDWTATLHELGHALGLKHPHEDGGYGALPDDLNCHEFTVMSYRSHIGAGDTGFTNAASSYPQTFMMYDIAALQHMYGADFSTNSSDTSYQWDPLTGDTTIDGSTAISTAGNCIFLTIWDGGGSDIYDLSAYQTDLQLDLAPGGHSVFSADQLARLRAFPVDPSHIARGNVFNALLYQDNLASLIENAIGGSGNDRVSGNQAANTLWGEDGDDTLLGLDNSDELSGGNGADTVYGGSGHDRLIGGSGFDQLLGGSGNDIYIVNAPGEAVEVAGQGTDTVRSTVSYALGAGIERLVLLGGDNLSGAGNSLANTLNGNNGNNSLSGGGDLDVLRGSWGNDTFTVDAQGEAVELAGQGIDTVRSIVSYSLGANFEHLTLLGTARLSGFGNGLANILTGNGAANILVGGGGVDVLRGGLGNDIYIVDAQGEAVELAGQGNDTVRSTVSYRLDSNLENLILLSAGNLQGSGNARDNNLIGNSGANRLSGGAGRDTLQGGMGDDAFLFTAPLSGATNIDVIRDMNERGNDTIFLDNAVFTALGRARGLGPGAFCSNSTGVASDTLDRIIFEFDTGEIYYDSNGSTAGGTYVLFARVDPDISLTAADFVVF